MSAILERYSQAEQRFRPQSVNEYFAWQVARKLGDEVRFQRYVSLTERFGVAELLKAYRKTKAGASGELVLNFITMLDEAFSEELNS